MVGRVVASLRDQQREDVRLRVMRLIAEDPEISSRQIAERVGVSNGSAYYVLTALVEKGFVKLDSFRNSSRKGQYVYILTPKGVREKSILTHRFIERKKNEFKELRAEIAALEEEVGISRNHS